MQTTTLPRDGGHKSVIICENGYSILVSTKTYKTKKGAEGANTRVDELCGPGYSKRNLVGPGGIARTTSLKTGKVQVNYVVENVTTVA
jgi:hypothetical protein